MKLLLIFTLIISINALDIMFQERKLIPFNSPDKGGQIDCKVPGDPICGNNAKCEANLLAITNYTCICNDNWFTPSMSNTSCTIEKKSKLTAFLLQGFLGWVGAGSFYLGWNLYGAASFITLGIVCLIVPLISCFLDKDEIQAISSFLGCISSLVILGMWISAIIYMAIDCNSNEFYNGTKMSIPCGN